MRSRSGRSTGPSSRLARRPPPPDVYLFPAVVGGGLGDIEETLAVGRRLEDAGLPIHLYRSLGRPLPRGVDGPWDWPQSLRRSSQLSPRSPSALTVVPAWGVSAAPGLPGALGRAGPWAEEAREVERTYGTDSTLHVSLEEFARTLPVALENRERLREGGVSVTAMADRIRASRTAGDLDRFREAFIRFRAFHRPNVLHVFATFRRDPGFAREFPAAVQTGPLWPGRYRRAIGRPFARRGSRSVVWYASPASAERIAPEVVRGLTEARLTTRLLIRTPRPWTRVRLPSWVEVTSAEIPSARWSSAFRDADLRIVTGSRTLLEALEVGGPFLYFNGILGEAHHTRRHRPEKLIALLTAYRDGLGPELRRDLADFARGRNLEAVARRAAGRSGGWRRFPPRWKDNAFPPPFDDAGSLIVAVAHALARTPSDAAGIVERVRAGSNP
ncbi:MAG: hypothetical protein ACLPZM_02845 [Thermoplasmata archaeon]